MEGESGEPGGGGGGGTPTDEMVAENEGIGGEMASVGEIAEDATPGGGGGSAGEEDSERSQEITFGDQSEMIQSASQGVGSTSPQGEAAEGGEADSGAMRRALPMGGKNKGRDVGVERGETMPTEI